MEKPKIDTYLAYGFYMDELRGVQLKPNKPPLISTFREFQDITGHQSQRISPDETPEQTFSHMETEMVELREAIESGDKNKVASEIPDLIIFLAKLSDHYALDLGEIISNKINRNGFKYPMNEVQRLIDEEGMTHKEAREHLKKNWNRSLDNDFI